MTRSASKVLVLEGCLAPLPDEVENGDVVRSGSNSLHLNNGQACAICSDSYLRPPYVGSNPSLGIADIDEGYDYHCSVGNEAQEGLVARGCYEPRYVSWCDDPVMIQICWCPNSFYFQWRPG